MSTEEQLQPFPSQQFECHWCDDIAVPQITFTGPNFPRPQGTKHFCSIACFYGWIDKVLKSRDAGGRLDQEVDWSGDSEKRLPPRT
jgi:hypothetical protein